MKKKKISGVKGVLALLAMMAAMGAYAGAEEIEFDSEEDDSGYPVYYTESSDILNIINSGRDYTICFDYVNECLDDPLLADYAGFHIELIDNNGTETEDDDLYYVFNLTGKKDEVLNNEAAENNPPLEAEGTYELTSKALYNVYNAKGTFVDYAMVNGKPVISRISISVIKMEDFGGEGLEIENVMLKVPDPTPTPEPVTSTPTPTMKGGVVEGGGTGNGTDGIASPSDGSGSTGDGGNTADSTPTPTVTSNDGATATSSTLSSGKLISNTAADDEEETGKPHIFLTVLVALLLIAAIAALIYIIKRRLDQQSEAENEARDYEDFMKLVKEEARKENKQTEPVKEEETPEPVKEEVQIESDQTEPVKAEEKADEQSPDGI